MTDTTSGWTESHKIATTYATEGIKAMVVANGGAVVAILSFAGNASAKIDTASVSNGLLAFAVGLGLALFVFFASYVSQGNYSMETVEGNSSGDRWRMAAMACALGSIFVFVAGCAVTWWGFQHPPARPAPKPPSVEAKQLSCTEVLDFIRAQADPGPSRARNRDNGSEAVLVRGAWVILPVCNRRP